MIIHGKAPFLECSSKGDKRFSAFYAVVRGRGRRTIEAIYQASKVFADNTTGLSIKEAKGRKPVNAEACRRLYSLLWDEYIQENPDLISLLVAANGVSDIFGRAGSCCQATELWRIRNKYINSKPAPRKK